MRMRKDNEKRDASLLGPRRRFVTERKEKLRRPFLTLDSLWEAQVKSAKKESEKKGGRRVMETRI